MAFSLPTGTFLECCTHTPQAVPLAAAVLELVHSRRVHAHPEPYVRRASLLAISQASSCGILFIILLDGERGLLKTGENECMSAM